MIKNIKRCIALICALLLAFALCGCGEKPPKTPWEWAQSIDENDIVYVEFTCRAEYYEKLAAESGAVTDGDNAVTFDDVSFKLSTKQLEKFRMNLYRLEEENFTEATGAANNDPTWFFELKMADETMVEISQSKSDKGALEMTFGEQLWIINSDKLDSFVDALIADCGYDFRNEPVASASDMTPEEVTGSDLVVGDTTDSYSTYGNLG